MTNAAFSIMVPEKKNRFEAKAEGGGVTIHYGRTTSPNFKKASRWLHSRVLTGDTVVGYCINTANGL
jgi:hypothetical protein